MRNEVAVQNAREIDDLIRQKKLLQIEVFRLTQRFKF